MLHMDVTTDGGTISIEIQDADGNVLFDEHDIGTEAFDVAVSGKVVVRITADSPISFIFLSPHSASLHHPFPQSGFALLPRKAENPSDGPRRDDASRQKEQQEETKFPS